MYNSVDLDQLPVQSINVIESDVWNLDVVYRHIFGGRYILVHSAAFC